MLDAARDFCLLRPPPSGLVFALLRERFLAGGASVVVLLEVLLAVEVDMREGGIVLGSGRGPKLHGSAALALDTGGAILAAVAVLEVTDTTELVVVRTDVLGEVETEATGTVEEGTVVGAGDFSCNAHELRAGTGGRGTLLDSILGRCGDVCRGFWREGTFGALGLGPQVDMSIIGAVCGECPVGLDNSPPWIIVTCPLVAREVWAGLRVVGGGGCSQGVLEEVGLTSGL